MLYMSALENVVTKVVNLYFKVKMQYYFFSMLPVMPLEKNDSKNNKHGTKQVVEVLVTTSCVY